jgi:hypothetical protein
MAELKTFLFTDIVRSVELKREMPGRSDAERDQSFIELVLTPHRERIEHVLALLGGRVVSTAGDGHFVVFSDTISAALWAVGLQRSHREEPIRTPRGGEVEVRISMHLGIPQLDPHDPDNFVGKPSERLRNRWTDPRVSKCRCRVGRRGDGRRVVPSPRAARAQGHRQG